MNFNAAQIKKKIRAIVEIAKARSIRATIPLAPDNEARVNIVSVLKSRMRVENEEQNLAMFTMADEILSKIKKVEEKSTNQKIEDLLDGLLNQAFWYHGQLAGLSTIWEFRVRIFGNKLGVRPNVPLEQKSSKNRANKSIQHRTLKDTIKEINKRCGQRLSLRLLELCDLRDSIVHCNPQGIRSYATQIFGKESLKPVRGNVVVLHIPNNGIKNLSDVNDEKEAEDQDIIGWFLEVFNSGLPKKAFAEFERSIRALDLLIAFHAYSFEDRSLIFNKVVIDGHRPTTEDIAKFDAYFSSPYSPGKQDVNIFFENIVDCFKNLK